MKAIILAAGQGTRLRPFTDTIPKCMVKFNNRAMLHYQMEALNKNGVSDITVVGGYCKDKLELKGAKLFENINFDKTNMVNTLFCAREVMSPNEDLIISYGDIVYEPRIVKELIQSDSSISISADLNWSELWKLRMENPLDDAETFIFDKSGRVLELGKKPNSLDQIDAQYMGLIKIKANTINKIIDMYDSIDRTKEFDGNDFDNMYMTSFIQYLIDNGIDVKASLVKGGWIEVDTVEDLQLYSRMNEERSLTPFLNVAAFS